MHPSCHKTACWYICNSALCDPSKGPSSSQNLADTRWRRCCQVQVLEPSKKRPAETTLAEEKKDRETREADNKGQEWKEMKRVYPPRSSQAKHGDSMWRAKLLGVNCNPPVGGDGVAQCIGRNRSQRRENEVTSRHSLTCHILSDVTSWIQVTSLSHETLSHPPPPMLPPLIPNLYLIAKTPLISA